MGLKLDWLQAVVLGIVQGVGEFLPISSSAHLVLVPWLMGWPYAGLTFDVALHVGTLFAVVSFFWRDWLQMAADGLRGKRTARGKMFWYLVIATIPGAVCGYLLEDYAETIFREPFLIGLALAVMGLILWAVDTRMATAKNMGDIGLKESFFIGLLQSLAIIPGVSRAGITMTAGRLLKLNRETAARFSFLLSTPIIFGAGVNQLSELSAADIDLGFLIGVFTSAIVGFLSIKFLLQYLSRHNFLIFVWYRLVVGMAVMGLAMFK